MSPNVQDWCTEHFGVFGEVTAAISRVTQAMNDATAIGSARGRLDHPDVRRAFSRIVAEAEACRAVVQEALDLPEIPDARSEIQFRDAMSLRGRWADEVAEAARTMDVGALDRANAFGDEATRQGALIAAELRRAWPSEPEA